MKNRKVFAGMGLILIAVVTMGSALGMIPEIPWFKLIGGIIFASCAFKSLVGRDFFGLFMALGVVGWIFEKELAIEHIAPFPLLVAAGCLGLGLNMIFGKRPKVISIRYKDDNEWKEGSLDDISREEWTSDGRHVTLENTFGHIGIFGEPNRDMDAPHVIVKAETNFGDISIFFD